MFTREYWEKRVSKHGHTGHGEAFLYCFDQEARKFAVKELLQHIHFKKKDKALDFGCGTGDFLNILNSWFKTVDGYDISYNVINKARKNLKHQDAITLTNDISEIEQSAPYDFILTVTVLQSLTKNELVEACKLLFNALDDNGYIVCMEFFTNEVRNTQTHENKATANEWLEILKSNQIEIISLHSFYNPVLYPSNSLKLYNNKRFLKLLKPLKRFRITQKILSHVAKKIIAKHNDVLEKQKTPFKIQILQKINHAH
jgi:cyclopropane fatty-acyl-phospholipid synthase-like methyltransferase